MIIALTVSAFALTREEALDRAAAYTLHDWTMTAENETASCSGDYQSDYTAGTWRGLPYDWGGYYTLDEFDAAIADGLGAGSHSWHGILSCTAGVDCSGYVSQVWDAPHNSTSTMYGIATDIALAEVLRADAFNDAGSHIVLYTYENDAGSPIFYEASGSGSAVRMNNFSGWSYLDGYQPIRFDGMSEDVAEPQPQHEIDRFPYEDMRWTAGSPDDAIDSYACAPDTDESGPEVLYHFRAATRGTLQAVVSDADGVDVDIHVLTRHPTGDSCVARDDVEVSIEVGPGDVWLSLDTYVGGREFPGPFLLTASFDGEIEHLDPEDTGWAPIDTGSDDSDASADGVGGPGARNRLAPHGCATGAGPEWLGALAAGVLVFRRKRGTA